MPALIFDCDGVLADTERDGHLPAFNDTFAHFGVPLRWDVGTYAEKVKIGGGKERMASAMTPEIIAAAGLSPDQESLRDAIAEWHAYKTEKYTSLIASGVVPPRPGVARLVAEAAAAGWQLAVASTSARPSVEAVLRRAVGDDLYSAFRIFAGDVVPRKKPHPDIYVLALEKLGVNAEAAVVIEDTEIGLRAAHAAGLRVVVTVSGLTAGEDFSGASLVLSSLGDPGESAVVLNDPFELTHTGLVDLSTLQGVLDRPRPVRLTADGA